jgi:hypothetical protein
MWLIGMVVCAALMLAGHAAMNAGHGSHSHGGAAAAPRPAPTAPAPDGVEAESAPESAPQPAPESHH